MVYSGGNGTGYSHQYFLPALGFIGPTFHTDFVAFYSYDLSYLVTFANHNTLRILRQGGKSKQYTLSVTLDDPNQCQNMAGQSGHYLICLAASGFCSVIISITATTTTEHVTSKTIPMGNSKIVRMEIIPPNTVYFLTEERVVSFYVVNSEVAYLGHHVVRDGIDFIVNNAISGLVCEVPNPERSDYTILIVCCTVFGSLLLLLPLGILLQFFIHIARRCSGKAPIQVAEVDDQAETTNFDNSSENDSGSDFTNTLIPESAESSGVSTASMASLPMEKIRSEYHGRNNA